MRCSLRRSAAGLFRVVVLVCFACSLGFPSPRFRVRAPVGWLFPWLRVCVLPRFAVAVRCLSRRSAAGLFRCVALPRLPVFLVSLFLSISCWRPCWLVCPLRFLGAVSVAAFCRCRALPVAPLRRCFVAVVVDAPLACVCGVRFFCFFLLRVSPSLGDPPFVDLWFAAALCCGGVPSPWPSLFRLSTVGLRRGAAFDILCTCTVCGVHTSCSFLVLFAPSVLSLLLAAPRPPWARAPASDPVRARLLQPATMHVLRPALSSFRAAQRAKGILHRGNNSASGFRQAWAAMAPEEKRAYMLESPSQKLQGPMDSWVRRADGDRAGDTPSQAWSPTSLGVMGESLVSPPHGMGGFFAEPPVDEAQPWGRVDGPDETLPANPSQVREAMARGSAAANRRRTRGADHTSSEDEAGSQSRSRTSRAANQRWLRAGLCC